VGARAALRSAVALLAARPLAVGGALLAGSASALALGAGEAAAVAVLKAHRGGSAGAASALFLLGGTVAALGTVTAIAATLDGRGLRGALRRGTGMISLEAVLRLIQLCLVIAAVFPAGRWLLDHPATAARRAVLLVACVAPTLPVWMVIVPAFAVAGARTAAGEPNWRALATGLDQTLHGFGPIVAAGLLALACTAPLWLPPVALAPGIAALQHPALAVGAQALSGALAMLAALVVYATLVATSEALEP
jgi:hypothetical protein